MVSSLSHPRGVAWDKAHGLAIKVFVGSHSWMRIEQPRGMLRLGWWKQDGDQGCVMPRRSTGRRNVVSWGNSAAEHGGSSMTVAEPPPCLCTPHTGPEFVPRWVAAPSSLSPSCSPWGCGNASTPGAVGKWEFSLGAGRANRPGLISPGTGIGRSNASGGWKCLGGERAIYCAG